MRVIQLMVASATVSFFATMAFAADHPVAADKLRILSPASSGKAWFYFRAVKENNVTLGTIADPTTGGATFEVFGSGVGDGSSGLLTLPAENWQAKGTPAGSMGYYYRDHDATHGVSQVRLQPGAQGGTLWITARGPVWTYPLTQPQTDVFLRLTIGGERYCARFTDLRPNRVGAVVAKGNAIIADCN